MEECMAQEHTCAPLASTSNRVIANTRARTHTDTHTYIHTYTYLRVHAHTHTHTHTHTPELVAEELARVGCRE